MGFKRRKEIRHYLKIDGAYELIGRGVMELNDSLNPVTAEEGYILDSSNTTTVDGYGPSWTFSMNVDTDDAFASFIRECARARATGEDAETYLVEFDAWDMDIDQTVPAFEQKVAVAVDYINNGDALAKIEMAGTLYGQGDPVSGDFDLATDTFTAAS
jgi:hypothetical protein